MLIQVAGAFLGIISVSIIYGVDRRFFKFCGICGAIGWMIYLVLNYLTGSEPLRIYIATLAVAYMAHIFARVLKAPVTLFLIPGILPLVPGIGMYRSVYNLIMVSNEMAGHYLMETLKAAGCIALAIFTMDTIFRMINLHSFLRRYVKQHSNSGKCEEIVAEESIQEAANFHELDSWTETERYIHDDTEDVIRPENQQDEDYDE